MHEEDQVPERRHPPQEEEGAGCDGKGMKHETQGIHGHDCQHAHKVALFSYITPLFMYQI